MTWEVIPEAEMPKVLDALKDHRCVACYGPIRPEHGGLYCCDCDDACSPECASSEVWRDR